MIRSFIAVPFPARVLDDLESAVAGLEQLGLPGRGVSRKAMHLTLKFLGSVGENQVCSIALTLRGLAGRTPPFDVSLKGPDAFPHRKAPRVVFVGVQRSDELVRLQGALEDDLTALGIKREGRPYRPHLTLLRLKSRTHRSHLQDWFTRELPVSSRSFRVGRFNLYQSVLKPSGAEYSVLENFPLRGGGA